MLIQEILWLVVFLIIAIFAAAFFKGEGMIFDSLDLDYAWFEWIKSRDIFTTYFMAVILISPLFFWGDSIITGLRPGIEEVYLDFRKNPDDWIISSQNRWVRTSDGLRMEKDFYWMALKGKHSFELDDSEKRMFKYAAGLREVDADEKRYREFSEGIKEEQLIK